jgi:putative exporter of polyketide antibiotics
MSETMITNIVYVVLIIIAVVGEHFNFLPSGSANLIIAAIGGHAAGTTSLVPAHVVSLPNAVITTQDQSNSSFVDETQDNTRG